MKVSLVATIYNEAKSIEEFIESILLQSKVPDEIIFVDAGSTDSTKKRIRKYRKILLFTKKGNRSIGRNYGIAKSTGDVIVVSDAGCVLDKNFLKYITSPFKKRTVDVVSGFYFPLTNSVFEKSLAAYTCTMLDKVDKINYLPSSRSVAFKKVVWESVGGYPEELDTCEDLVFARNMRKKKHSFIFTEKAFVWWKQRGNWKEAWEQFYNYAVGDGQALFIRPQTPLLFLRYAIGIILLFVFISTLNIAILFIMIGLLIIYILWSIQKNYKYVKSIKALYYLPILQFVADTAVIVGMSFGIMKVFIKKSK